MARRLHWRRLGLSRDHGWWAGPAPTWPGEVVAYGMRGQVGGMITLLNLRLDFAILGAMAGPAVLGTYAVASKYAELLRLPGTALTWVTYPRLAAHDRRRGGCPRPPAAGVPPWSLSPWRWCRSSCSPDR